MTKQVTNSKKKGWEMIIPFPKKKNDPVKNVYNENLI